MFLFPRFSVGHNALLRIFSTILVWAFLLCSFSLYAQSSKKDIISRSKLVEVYKPKQAIRWTIKTGQLKEAGSSVAWEIRSWPNKAVVKKGEISSKDSATIAFTPTTLGYFELAVFTKGPKENQSVRDSLSFVVNSSSRSSGKYFRFGVSTHSSEKSGRIFEKEVELIRLLGLDIVRDEPIRWAWFEPKEKQWNYSAGISFFRAMKRLKVDLNVILNYTVDWANKPGAAEKRKINQAPKLEAYLNYVSEAVKFKKDEVKYWEIWNEPDHGAWQSSTEEYIEMFNAASKRIKEIQPTAKVLNGGFAMGRSEPNPDFLEKFIKQADTKYWDIWAYHDYNNFNDFLKRQKQKDEAYAAANLSVPQWVNEGGFTSMLSGGEKEQAITLVKKMAGAPSLGATGYFWYDLRNDGPNTKDYESNFGLSRFNGDPKPAYAAYMQVIKNLNNAKYQPAFEKNKLPEGTRGFLFKKDVKSSSAQENILVVWNDGKERPITISGGKIASVTDIMGNPLSYKAGTNSAQLTLGSAPVYVHLRGTVTAATLKVR